MNIATTAIWLASAAAAIHIIVGAMQSNSFNALLAQFSIPAVPQKAFPWIGVILGLAGGVVSGLQQGQIWSQALATAVLGMLTGGASAMHVETMGGNITNVPKPKAGSGGSGTVEIKNDSDKSVITTVVTVPSVPVPPVAKRIRLFAPAFIVIALITMTTVTVPMATTGCGWWSANSAQVVTDIGQIGSCVVAQLFQGISDPAKIASSCTGSTLAEVESIIASVINYYDQPTVDSGTAVASSGQHCGAGSAPFKGMPACVSTIQLAGFKTMRAQLVVQLGGAH